ncbi:MBL fold metallo-hydrolase [bacterium]|nr:MBL fold metallo-hydrolase [bacterium]
MTQDLRILEPFPGILAFYDGRIPGHRFLPFDNWVDDGAISLGIASYAILGGTEALVYDTHVSIEHARAIRAELTARGISRITVVLSHWHLDHVAGTEVFADCPIIANSRTLAHLRDHKSGIEDASFHGKPAIAPLILPDRTFEGEMTLTVGTRQVRLIEANIHSDDATVLWLADEGILLAGDTVEDCVTYVGAPADLALHLEDLDRLAALEPRHVLPNHGDAGVIATGGYPAEILRATQRYIRWLLGLQAAPVAAHRPFAEVIAADVALGTLIYFAPYEAVHAQNIRRCLDHWQEEAG